MLLLDDNEMSNVVFLAIQQRHGTKNTMATDIFNVVTKKISSKPMPQGSTTQDICDTVLACFDFYNAFVTEKNIDLPIILDEAYNVVVDVLNEVIQEEML